MSKKEKLLNAFKENLNEWVCGYHNSDSNQPAAIFREIKKEGYEFKEIEPNRWGKKMYCNFCKKCTTHYKLQKEEPVNPEKKRFNINKEKRSEILKLLKTDAFTGASITSTPEIDHKTPFIRLSGDIKANTMEENEILEHFQLLTREHNLLKDRACTDCFKSNKRPPLFGIKFWYKGDENFVGNCIGCGWHDGSKWREELNNKLKPN